MRCFLAIELSEAARRHLERVQGGLRPEIPKASCPNPSNLHVTLRFLGETSDKQLADLCESMQHVKLSGGIELSATQLSACPQRGLARILVASMAGSEAAVAALHSAVEQRCRKLGFESEPRKYHPHVTLARLKPGLPPAQRQRLVDAVNDYWPGPGFEVTQFVLFESHLHPFGSRYVKLATFPLH